jgi:hypothetical protein
VREGTAIHRSLTPHGLCVAAGLLMVVVGFFTAQDALAGLRITAPADGTVVAPGETLTVTVAVDPDSRYHAVRVVGELIGLSGLAQAVTAPPYQFAFTMPADGIGPQRISAVGTIGPGHVDFSPPVTIDLETPASITRLTVNRARVTFDYPGQQLPLVVTGTTETGAALDLSHSSRTGYHSVNPAVATMTGGRLLTAVGPGSTTVTVAYQGRAVAIPVTVPKTIPGDFNGDGVVDQDDVNWLAAVAAAHLPPAGTFDARDLNHDGVIDRRDVRRLLSLCSGNCVMPHVPPGR